jgi:hypothetical protein
VDEEKARQKEAKRTLDRIRRTLNNVQDESGNRPAVEESKEYRRMKDLLEHGYSHNKPGLLEQILILIKHPVFLVFLVLIVLTLLIN